MLPAKSIAAHLPTTGKVIPLRLSKSVKAGYGAAELGTAAVELFLQIYLLKFYTDVVGLSPRTAGFALALAVIWDAVSDPLMGGLSDKTHSRWGRRRPYILAGALLLAGAYVLLFNPPVLVTETGKFTFLLVGYLVVNTAMTLLSVPHAALGGELTRDADERTEVFGWRFFFANLGLVFGILVPGILAAGLAEGQSPAGPSAPWIAGAVVLSALVTLFATRRHDRSQPGDGFSLGDFWRSLRAVLLNKPFIPLLVAFVVGSLGRTLNASIALFYYDHRLNLPEAQVFLYVLLPFTFVIALSIVGWTLIARRAGKKMPAFWGILLLGLGTCVAYPLFPPGQILPVVFAGIVGGFLVGSIFLLDATVADMVDYDELKSGAHREGIYFGFWRMGSKLARALGLALSGLLLEGIGFEIEATTQSDETVRGLALIFGPGVGIFFVAAAFIYLAMPLTKEKVAIVQRRLRRREQRRVS